MSGLKVELAGSGSAIAEVRERLQASRLDIEVVACTADHPDHPDHSGCQVVVTSAPAAADSFLGVADHRRPNVFHVGQDGVPPRLTARYVVSAIEELFVTGATEMRVREPIARSWARYVAAKGGGGRTMLRKLKRFDPSDFDYRSEHDDDDVYDGAAVVEHDLEPFACRIRVSGYFDPVDGHYHWAGIAFGEAIKALKDARASDVLVGVGDRDAVPARLTEITPWGSVRIVGIGQPPYALDDVEVVSTSPGAGVANS